MELRTGTYDLAPEAGWGSFRSAAILDAIWAQLTLVENGGDWRYYNFTSTSSVFDSDTDDVNRITIEFAELPSDTRNTQQIQSMMVELDDAAILHYNGLLQLIDTLRSEFGLLAQLRGPKDP